MPRLEFVLDASVTLTWAFSDESAPVALCAEQILKSPGGGAIVPALWWYEIRNILIVNERCGRITPDVTAVFLSQIGALPITTVRAPEDGILLDLSRRLKLTVYDAAYLALCVERNLPLATLDQVLQRAAVSVKVALLTDTATANTLIPEN
jgi:predicted nucleic acid-binding protein